MRRRSASSCRRRSRRPMTWSASTRGGWPGRRRSSASATPRWTSCSARTPARTTTRRRPRARSCSRTLPMPAVRRHPICSATCRPSRWPRTWTSCVRPLARISWTTSAPPTAPTSARHTPRSSLTASAGSSSTGPSIRPCPTWRSASGRPAASSRPPGPMCRAASRRATARSVTTSTPGCSG